MPLALIASSHCGLLAGHIIFGKIIVSSLGTAVLCGATSVPLFCYLLITIKNQCYDNNLRLMTIIIGGPPTTLLWVPSQALVCLVLLSLCIHNCPLFVSKFWSRLLEIFHPPLLIPSHCCVTNCKLFLQLI
jgi:hypothetical protein